MSLLVANPLAGAAGPWPRELVLRSNLSIVQIPGELSGRELDVCGIAHRHGSVFVRGGVGSRPGILTGGGDRIAGKGFRAQNIAAGHSVGRLRETHPFPAFA